MHFFLFLLHLHSLSFLQSRFLLDFSPQVLGGSGVGGAVGGVDEDDDATQAPSAVQKHPKSSGSLLQLFLDLSSEHEVQATKPPPVVAAVSSAHSIVGIAAIVGLCAAIMTRITSTCPAVNRSVQLASV